MKQTEVNKTFMMISNLKKKLVSMVHTEIFQRFNPLTAGAEYIRFLIFTLKQ